MQQPEVEGLTRPIHSTIHVSECASIINIPRDREVSPPNEADLAFVVTTGAMFADYYQILGVKEDADQATIRRARNRLIKKFHTDKPENRDNPENTKRAQEINDAFNILGDPAKRAQYDSDRKAGTVPPPPPKAAPRPKTSVSLITFGDVTPGSTSTKRVTIQNLGDTPENPTDVTLIPDTGDIQLGFLPASDDDPFPLTITLTLHCSMHVATGAQRQTLSVKLDNAFLKIPVIYNVIAGDVTFSTYDEASDDVDDYIPPPIPPSATSASPATPLRPVVDLTGTTTPRSGLFLGWCVGILFYIVAGGILTPFVTSFPNTPGRNVFLFFGTAWLICSAICAGMMTTGAIRSNHRKVMSALRVLVVSSLLLAALSVPTLHPFSIPSTTGNQEIRTFALIVPLEFQNQDLKTQLLNASYPSNCFKIYSDLGIGSTIPLRNGQWDNGQTDPVKHPYFGIMGNGIMFTNLTRDGHREAVVPTYCGIDASTESYSEVFVIDTSSPALNVLARLSPEDWGDGSRGITWNTSDVQVANGFLLVSFRLGGFHAQPDWDAISGFTWDGNRFIKSGFEAHGEAGGSHPNEVIREGANLPLSDLQFATQANAPSNSANGNSGEQSSPGSTNNTGAPGAGQSSAQASTDGSHAAPVAQTPSGPPALTTPQWLAFAESQLERDDFNGALQSCDVALQIDPQSADAVQLKRKIESTMRILNPPATAPTPSAPQGMTGPQWLARAEGQFERNDFKGALQSCNAALQIDSGNSQALQLKGKISATMKVLGDAQ